jgi:hypothetical protein
MKRKHISIICLLIAIPQLMMISSAQVPVEYSQKNNRIRISDKEGDLILGIDCNNRCIIDNVEALGHEVVSNQKGVFSSIKSNGILYTSGSGIHSPEIKSDGETVTIDKIKFGEKGNEVTEKWIFQAGADFIDWTIERTYAGNITLEDTGFPEWSFNSIETWTGALLGTGGVAWCRFFDKPNASLANHTGKVTFWNNENKACLSIEPTKPAGQNVAVRFSRQPDKMFTLNYSVTEDELRTKHFLSRFIIDRQDIWDSFDATGRTSITYRLRAMNYDKAFYRGDFKGLRTESVRSLLNTIARVGVIDERLMGSNNWHLDMGFVCLHEHWIAQMGLAIDDQDYFDNYRKTLDYFRDNAVSSDGNVKDRWAYRIWDAEPGTFENGFYTCQWGDLLDANTDYVINVSELFMMNGDTDWVRSHKLKCEKALEFLLKRDSDRNGLIEAFADSHTQNRGSDWIDVIWASWENAFINAKLYYALTQWADIEEISGDSMMAVYYRDFAEKCKYSFNQPVAKGGFWNPDNKWYVYWRDKDGSAHGDNLVTPVNFMAIAYGICDDKSRKNAVLSRIESLMQEEKLFFWPISFFPYKPDEGLKVNYPFPNYENGDIFLAWGEVGIRAYQDFDPSIPVRYIKNVLRQYETDGLAFQRYKRNSAEGEGNDILANNCLPVVGLYRDIYGIQPQYNRLYLEPHMSDELNGTEIKYNLRKRDYLIRVSRDDYSVSTGSFTVRTSTEFGINLDNNRLLFFEGKNTKPSMSLKKDKQTGLQIKIFNTKGDDNRIKKWSETAGAETLSTDYEIFGLFGVKNYQVLRNGSVYRTLVSDAEGKISFSSRCEPAIENILEIRQIE